MSDRDIINNLDINDFSLDSIPVDLKLDGFKFLIKYSKKRERIFTRILDCYLKEFNDENINMMILCDSYEEKSYVKNLINFFRSRVIKKNFPKVFFADNNLKYENLFPAVDAYIDVEFSSLVFKAMACGTWILTTPNQFIQSKTPYSIDEQDDLYLQTKLRVVYDFRGYDRKKIRKNFDDICKEHNIVFIDNRLDLSVCILTHNNPDVIRCLNLIKAYGKCKEIIVVDNGSYIDNGLDKYRGIIYRKLETNQGVIKGRNFAASIATCKYIMFLDDDQFVSENSIKKLHDAVEGGADCAGAILNRFDKNASGYPIYKYQDDDKWIYLGAGGFIIRRDLFMQIGGYDEIFGMAYCEDPDLFWRLREKGCSWVWISDAEIVHKEHSTLFNQKTFNWKNEWIKSHKVLKNRWFNTEINIRESYEEHEINSKVAIFIICHNRYSAMFKCINNLVNVIDKKVSKIYILDNGSTDKRCVDFLSNIKDDRVMVFRSDVNLYCGPGRKFLLDAVFSLGEEIDYCVFLDDDVYLTQKGFEKKLINVFENNSEIACIQGLLILDNNIIQASLCKTTVFDGVLNRFFVDDEKDYRLSDLKMSFTDNVIGGFNIIRKDVLFGIYKYLGNYVVAKEDVDYSFRISYCKHKMLFYPWWIGIHLKNYNDNMDLRIGLDMECDSWRIPNNLLKTYVSFKSLWGLIMSYDKNLFSEYNDVCLKKFGVTFNEINTLGFGGIC